MVPSSSGRVRAHQETSRSLSSKGRGGEEREGSRGRGEGRRGERGEGRERGGEEREGSGGEEREGRGGEDQWLEETKRNEQCTIDQVCHNIQRVIQ